MICMHFISTAKTGKKNQANRKACENTGRFRYRFVSSQFHSLLHSTRAMLLMHLFLDVHVTWTYIDIFIFMTSMKRQIRRIMTSVLSVQEKYRPVNWVIRFGSTGKTLFLVMLLLSCVHTWSWLEGR